MYVIQILKCYILIFFPGRKVEFWYRVAVYQWIAEKL